MLQQSGQELAILCPKRPCNSQKAEQQTPWTAVLMTAGCPLELCQVVHLSTPFVWLFCSLNPVFHNSVQTLISVHNTLKEQSNSTSGRGGWRTGMRQNNLQFRSVPLVSALQVSLPRGRVLCLFPLNILIITSLPAGDKPPFLY